MSKNYETIVRFPKGPFRGRIRRACLRLTMEERERRPEFMGSISINEVIVRAVEDFLDKIENKS